MAEYQRIFQQKEKSKGYLLAFLTLFLAAFPLSKQIFTSLLAATFELSMPFLPATCTKKK